MNYKIAAVVVTFNRLELLKQCIESLRNQTHKLDEIFVINNSSTDGTLDWLDEQTDLTVITQENSGSAGGQFTGIKTAYEKGYDWIWCFDDDCRVEECALELLLEEVKNNSNISVISSVIFIEDTKPKLSFFTPIFINSKFSHTTNSYNELTSYSKKQNIIPGHAYFFCSVLLHKSTIAKVGLPIKELFIWGDEVEYQNRIRNHGIQTYTSLKSKCFHPENRWTPIKYVFNQEIYPEKNDWKAYYYFRNRAFIARCYHRSYNIRYFISQCLFFILKRNFDLNSTFYFVSAYIDGLRKDPTKKIPF